MGLYTDGSSIFSWDIVLNSPVRRLTTGLSKATALAVDVSRGFIFVLEQVQSKNDTQLKPSVSSVVSRYPFWLEKPLKNDDGGVL